MANATGKSVAQEVRETVTNRLKEIRAAIGPLVKEESELVQMAPGESGKFGHQEQKVEQPEETPAPTPAAAPSATETRRRRKRKGGTRSEQALAFIQANPGSSASEVAQSLNLKPNYLYRVLGEMEKEGRVTKEGMKYSASAA